MSMMDSQTLQCPKCGNSQEATIWHTINVGVDPDLKQSLLQGEINIFACVKCGEQAFVNIPLMYHDMDQKFCVQYYPPEALDEAEFFRLFNGDGSIAMSEKPLPLSGSYIAHPHIVFDMGEMVRYVVFRDRINSGIQQGGPEDTVDPGMRGV
jgi:hypothetical protein